MAAFDNLLLDFNTFKVQIDDFLTGDANSRFIYATNMNPLRCTKILKEKATQFNKPKIYNHICSRLVERSEIKSVGCL